MTDARFPERWLCDRRFQRLSDAHFRSYVTALMWGVSNRTDGVIEPEDLHHVPNFAAGATKALVAVGLWEPRSGDRGWLIADYALTQTTAAQLKANELSKAKEREKKARQRAEKRAAQDRVPGDVPGDVPAESTGQDRPGQDRPGHNQRPVGENDENSRPENNGPASFADADRQAIALGFRDATERARLNSKADAHTRAGYET